MFGFFSKQKETCFSRNEDMGKVFNILATLTPDASIRDDFWYKLEGLKKSRSADIFTFTRLYLDWEDFVITQQKVGSGEVLTASILRKKINTEIPLNKVDIAFGLIFEKREIQIIYLAELFLHFVSLYVIDNLGIDVLITTNASLTINEISEKVNITKDGFDFRQFNTEVLRAKREAEEQILSLFKVYFEVFSERVEVSFGNDVTKQLFNGVYEKLHKVYNSEIVSEVLVVIPERVLNLNAWLSMLSKGELEERVREKTNELEILNKQLEQKVEERVVELKKAYADLQELDQRKSEFISLVGHQMRTPLVAVKWALSLLKEEDTGPLTDTQKKVVEDAMITNDSMNNVVNEILMADDIMNNKAVYKIASIDLNTMLDEVLATVAEIAKRKELTFKREVTVKSLVAVDKDKFKYVLSAVIDNAIRYSSPESSIVLLAKEESTGIVSLSVIDYGIGIPLEVQKRVGDRFFRADNALRQNTYGSGLGIYIVKNIIEACGGSISITSEEGKGTNVTINLKTFTI